jgi:hypothetical protein
MRVDPRFLPLTEKLGYVEYWKKTGTKLGICSAQAERTIPLCKALQWAISL